MKQEIPDIKVEEQFTEGCTETFVPTDKIKISNKERACLRAKGLIKGTRLKDQVDFFVAANKMDEYEAVGDGDLLWDNHRKKFVPAKGPLNTQNNHRNLVLPDLTSSASDLKRKRGRPKKVVSAESEVLPAVKEESQLPRRKNKKKKTSVISFRNKENFKIATVKDILASLRFNPIVKLVELYEATPDPNLQFRIAKEILSYTHVKPQPEVAQTAPVSFNIMIAGDTQPRNMVADKKIIDVKPVIELEE